MDFVADQDMLNILVEHSLNGFVDCNRPLSSNHHPSPSRIRVIGAEKHDVIHSIGYPDEKHGLVLN